MGSKQKSPVLFSIKPVDANIQSNSNQTKSRFTQPKIDLKGELLIADWLSKGKILGVVSDGLKT